MIRAVVEDGRLRPLDPLPPGCREGQVVGLEVAPWPEDDGLDAWARDLAAIGPARYEAGEREGVEAALAEADALEKARVRAEMGPP